MAHNLFHKDGGNPSQNPWMQGMNLMVGGDDSSEEEESKDAALQEEIDPEIARMKREAKEFKALLLELVYISKNPKNEWKRREVAILLLGMFIKDVSAFLIRNPYYEQLQDLFDQIIATDFSKAPGHLWSLLIGRSLQTATAIIDCDIVPRGDHGDSFKNQVMVFAFE